MSLRRYFQLIGWSMIVVGFAFWGYHWPMARFFGISMPAPPSNAALDKALSFGGLFGGALMLHGFTCLGMATVRDTRFLRCASKYVLIGYGFLAFVTFAKQIGDLGNRWRRPAPAGGHAAGSRLPLLHRDRTFGFDR